MAKTNTKDRMKNEINAGSMADIAFLLLIFFLVTTTIDVDKGITVKLPPWSEEEPDITELKKRNVLSVLVNKDNRLLVRGEEMKLGELKDFARNFIENPMRRDDLSENPKNAIISLKNDRGTEYGTYLEVYNEMKAAYNELWNEEARKMTGKDYSDKLPLHIRKEIKTKIPFVLSEAEPTEYGGE